MKTYLAIAFSLALAGAAMAGSIISASEAKKHVGEELGVAGYVSEVVVRSGDILIKFKSDNVVQKFNGLIPQAKVDDAGGLLFLNTLPGQFVTIAGKVRSHNGSAEIVVEKKTQFLVAQK